MISHLSCNLKQKPNIVFPPLSFFSRTLEAGILKGFVWCAGTVPSAYFFLSRVTAKYVFFPSLSQARKMFQENEM